MQVMHPWKVRVYRWHLWYEDEDDGSGYVGLRLLWGRGPGAFQTHSSETALSASNFKELDSRYRYSARRNTQTTLKRIMNTANIDEYSGMQHAETLAPQPPHLPHCHYH